MLERFFPLTNVSRDPGRMSARVRSNSGLVLSTFTRGFYLPRSRAEYAVMIGSSACDSNRASEKYSRKDVHAWTARGALRKVAKDL